MFLLALFPLGNTSFVVDAEPAGTSPGHPTQGNQGNESFDTRFERQCSWCPRGGGGSPVVWPMWGNGASGSITFDSRAGVLGVGVETADGLKVCTVGRR